MKQHTEIGLHKNNTILVLEEEVKELDILYPLVLLIQKAHLETQIILMKDIISELI